MCVSGSTLNVFLHSGGGTQTGRLIHRGTQGHTWEMVHRVHMSRQEENTEENMRREPVEHTENGSGAVGSHVSHAERMGGLQGEEDYGRGRGGIREIETEREEEKKRREKRKTNI